MSAEKTIDSSVEELKEIFIRYSAQDVATSLFVSAMWLPNIASLMKHSLLTAVFASFKPEALSLKNQIKTYDDFKEFCKTVYRIIPDFQMMEDYVPEIDWGDVKFHHDGKSYRIFYGNDIENIYDYLTLFEVLYGEYNKEYADHTGRFPLQELGWCLELQDHIITAIRRQPDQDDIDISPGHIEVPPEEFWKETARFYVRFKPEEVIDRQFVERMSLNLGDLSSEILQDRRFEETAFTGELLPYMFIRFKERFFPVLPRRFSGILLDKWGAIIREFHHKVEGDTPYATEISIAVAKFIRQRYKKGDFFPLVCAITADEKYHEALFAVGFISQDRIILVYITPPAVDSRKVSKHLTEVTPKIKEALSLIGSSPTKFGLVLNNEGVKYSRRLEPELLVVIPQVSSVSMPIDFPKELPGRVMFLDELLGLVDELEDVDELAGYLDFLKDIETKANYPMISMLDKYAAYKDSLGTLVPGVTEPHFIMLDPHWGSNYRFRSLQKFWKTYPDVGFFGHPRSWKVSKETESRIRLESRSYLGGALYCRVKNTNVFLYAPFHEMIYEQGLIANLLMGCVADYLQRNVDVAHHRFFSGHHQLEVIFFPSSVIAEEKYKHIRHLDPGEDCWKADIGKLKSGSYGIRIVFNEDKLTELLAEVTDRQVELDLLKEIVSTLDRVAHDPNLPSICQALDATLSQRPRFRIFHGESPAAFPDFIRPCKPNLAHFKAARKRIAQLAKEKGFTEGKYTNEEAKNKLNTLKAAIVAEINGEVKRLDYAKVLPQVITRIDALTHENERQSFVVEKSVEHEVDYDRAEALTTQDNEFIRLHKSYRYLVEKLVQLRPSGGEDLPEEECKYLLALVDWLMCFQGASDQLHYEIGKTGIRVRNDLVVELIIEEGMEKKQEEFYKERMQLKLGQIGNTGDGVSSPRSLKEFMGALDAAFSKDFGFQFRNLITMLALLARWPQHRDGTDEATFYAATGEEIAEVCLVEISDLSKEEVQSIIDFLTLRSEEVLRVLDQEEDCPDIPIWEHNKRPARYNLRPLILIEEKYYWGAHSARKSGIIWSGLLPSGALPVDLRKPKIEEVLAEEKRMLGKALSAKAGEIVRRHTSHVHANAKLHTLDKGGNHPSELGDYDVLAYFPDKNVVLNVECKDMLQVFCLKDARTLREKIFGVPGKDEGHLEKINRRQQYLEKHIAEVSSALRWGVGTSSPPRVIPVYVTSRSYWWTKFPPREVIVDFVQIEVFDDYLQRLEAR